MIPKAFVRRSVAETLWLMRHALHEPHTPWLTPIFVIMEWKQDDDLLTSVDYFEIRIELECMKPTDIPTVEHSEYNYEMSRRIVLSYSIEFVVCRDTNCIGGRICSAYTSLNTSSSSYFREQSVPDLHHYHRLHWPPRPGIPYSWISLHFEIRLLRVKTDPCIETCNRLTMSRDYSE